MYHVFYLRPKLRVKTRFPNVQMGSATNDLKDSLIFSAAERVQPKLLQVLGTSRRICGLCFRLLSIPGNGALQPLLEIHLWLITQVFGGPGNVAQRMPDVASALRLILNVALIADNFLERRCCLIQRNTFAGGDVEHASRSFGGRCLAS